MTDKTTETVTVSIWPTVWKYSIILAACSFAFTLVRYFTGLAASTGMGLIGIVIAIVVLVIGLRSYRSLNKGYMTFGTATLAGFMINFLSSVISSALNAAYLAFIDNSIMTQLYDQTMTQLQQSPGMNPDMLEMMSGIYKAVFSPAGMLIMGVIGGVIFGIIIALILAAILKKDPPIIA